MKRPRFVARPFFAAAAVALSSSVATSDIIHFTSDTQGSTENLGSFTGWMDYDADFQSGQGLLSISITNTSDADNGGYLTSFAFNVNSSANHAVASLLTAADDFSQLNKPKANPFGSFDMGAGIGKNWQGGGPPHNGLAVGETGLFEFLIEAEDALVLSAASFFGEPGSDGMVVRFRGFADGGSDKVPAMAVTQVVPAPAALSLLLLAGLARRRRRG